MPPELETTRLDKGCHNLLIQRHLATTRQPVDLIALIQHDLFMQDTRDSDLKAIATRDVRAQEAWSENSLVVARTCLHYIQGNAMLAQLRSRILTDLCALPGHNHFEVAAEAITTAYPKATLAHANHYIA